MISTTFNASRLAISIVRGNGSTIILILAADEAASMYLSNETSTPSTDGHIHDAVPAAPRLLSTVCPTCELHQGTTPNHHLPIDAVTPDPASNFIFPFHSVFRSVMGQILASLEPLPITALNAMRQCFPCDDDHYDVKLPMGHLGSLVSGTSDLHTPIHPLHASFYDFLTDESRSQDFFVDASAVQEDLAFATLVVMHSEHGLRFNICSLENSYLPNSSVPDLEKRVKESISVELSYSCRFWGTHVSSTSFESSLAKEVDPPNSGRPLATCPTRY